MLLTFLEMATNDDGRSLNLDYCVMIESLQSDFDMKECSQIIFSIRPETSFQFDTNKPLPDDVTPSQKLTRSLSYLSCTTRLYIAYTAGYLSGLMHKPAELIWTTAK